MYNLKAIAAFLPAKLNNALTVANTSTALKQWLHGDTAPVVDTLQALTGKSYPKRAKDQIPENYRADLVTALKSSTGADSIKARLHALGETLESTSGDIDLLDLAGNVPALIKTHLEECKAIRAELKASKAPSEAVTVTPTVSKAKQPATVATPTISAQSVIDALTGDLFSSAEVQAIYAAVQVRVTAYAHMTNT